MKHKRILFIIVIVACLLLATAVIYMFYRHGQNVHKSQPIAQPIDQTQPSQSATAQPSQQANEAPAQTQPSTPPLAQQWPVQISQADAASLTVVVNKKHQLPSSYVPASIVTFGGRELRSEAATAMNALFNAAQTAGYSLKMISGYRSYSYQQTLYNNYVAQDGQAQADTYSARPGFSEHQLGLAADIGNGVCDLDVCFGTTAAGKWVADNAQNYGFIVRYPQGKDAETGYQYEPWHLRYLGTDVAKSVYASGKTLDQYYNVAAGGYQ